MDSQTQMFLLGIFAAVLLFMGFALECRRLANGRAQDPRVVVRRCKLILWDVKRQLSGIEATREVHELMDECNRAEQIASRAEAELGAQSR